MVELKGKIDKYKDVHFSKEKPFIKKKITKPAANIPLPKFDFKPLPRMEVKTDAWRNCIRAKLQSYAAEKWGRKI